MVQWLRFHAFTAGDMGSTPGQGAEHSSCLIPVSKKKSMEKKGVKNIFMHVTSPRLYPFLLRIVELLRCAKSSPLLTCLFTLRNWNRDLEETVPAPAVSAM